MSVDAEHQGGMSGIALAVAAASTDLCGAILCGVLAAMIVGSALLLAMTMATLDSILILPTA